MRFETLWLFGYLLRRVLCVEYANSTRLVLQANLVKRKFHIDDLEANLNRPLRRRAPGNGYVDVPLLNLVDFYTVELSIGTPPQPLTLLLDTGSSDMWVYSPGIAEKSIPSFTMENSQTFHRNNTKFKIRYVSGAASGEWGTDNVQIEHALLHSQSFAVVTKGTNLSGVPGLLGVGLMALESTGGSIFGRHYVNVPVNLAQQGFIASAAYSLYLNDVKAKTGTILFGGVDHDKYLGKLHVVPRVDARNFDVRVNSVSLGDQTLKPFKATLDSGTSLGLLPNSMLMQFATVFGLRYDKSASYYYVEDLWRLPKVTAVFNLSGVSLSVTADKFFIRGDLLGPPFTKSRYVFGFLSSEENSNAVIFGDVFMRNFYIVYDCNLPQIAIAPANFNSVSSRIEPIIGQTIPNSERSPNFAQDLAMNYDDDFGEDDFFNEFKNSPERSIQSGVGVSASVSATATANDASRNAPVLASLIRLLGLYC